MKNIERPSPLPGFEELTWACDRNGFSQPMGRDAQPAGYLLMRAREWGDRDFESAATKNRVVATRPENVEILGNRRIEQRERNLGKAPRRRRLDWHLRRIQTADELGRLLQVLNAQGRQICFEWFKTARCSHSENRSVSRPGSRVRFYSSPHWHALLIVEEEFGRSRLVHAPTRDVNVELADQHGACVSWIARSLRSHLLSLPLLTACKHAGMRTRPSAL